MPNVIHEVKLDFKDVLLRPKRSSIRSRADVEIRRKFTFLHSKRVHEGVPIIASNMDTVGTFEMAAALAKVCFTFYILSEAIYNILRCDVRCNDSEAIVGLEMTTDTGNHLWC